MLIGYFLKAEKHGILLKPYYFMLKTIAFNSWMERIGGRFRRFWLTFFDLGAAMGLGLMVFALYTFALSISLDISSLLHRTQQGSPAFLIIPLPGLTVSWEIFPYILIAIAVLLIPHEAAHGIASVLDKVPIKSSGVFMAIFLPGGFVEIDEEDLAKRKPRTKLRVFAAGSFTNTVTWILVLLLFVAFYQPSPSGVLITGIVDGGAAQTYHIPQWSVITQAYNASGYSQINNVQDLSNFMVQQDPGHNLTINLNGRGNLTLITKADTTNPNRALIGITTFTYFGLRIPILPNQAAYYLFNIFRWNEIILLGVAIVNMLPLFPFDGDRYMDTLLGLLGMKNTKPARTIASFVALGLLLANLILSFILFGTVFPG